MNALQLELDKTISENSMLKVELGEIKEMLRTLISNSIKENKFKKLTIKEASLRTGKSYKVISSALKRGSLKYTRPGKVYNIDETDLENWVNGK
jgi:excisionase family DNA binding protein